jgi:hypothetical protein
MIYSDGSVFEGDFDAGKPISGTFLYKNGDSYKGTLRDCVPDGEGVWKDKNGTFDGTFVEGEFVKGTVRYSDGSVYTGHMKGGEKHG